MPTRASLAAPASPCPACGGSLSFWFTKRTGDGDFPVRRCGMCRSAFAMPRPEPEALAALYRLGERHAVETVEQRHAAARADIANGGAMTLDGRRIAARLLALGAGKRLLDVGAGDGLHAWAIAQTGFAVDALEPGGEAREVFRRLNGFDPMDGFLDETFVGAGAGLYDVVLLSQVMEHLPDPAGAAAMIGRLLRPGGIAAIAVPQFRGWLSRLRGRKDMFISPPAHINFFTRTGLGALMEGHGFTREHAETVTWFDPDRVAGRIPLRILRKPALAGLRGFFALADRARGGNTLEAYFRKAVH